MADPYSIVEYRQNRSYFLDILRVAARNDLPCAMQYDLESRYRKAEHGESFADLSFLLLKSGKISACVLAHKYGTVMGFNGSGADIICGNDNAALKSAIDTLSSAAVELGLNSICVADANSGKMLGPMGLECYGRNASPRYRLRAQIDLLQPEKELHAGLRKSYKSLVNKGRMEMEFRAITKDSFDEKAFRDFKEFHLNTAGRQTRSSQSWDMQLEMIREGTAELLMGYLPSHGLVSSALFTDFGPATNYAVAVYNRKLFDHPLAHANVYEGILRAKGRGQSLFNLGIMPMPGEANEKELNIAKFKKGFVPSLTGVIEWTIPPSNTLKEKR